jgi:hypothetical protein
MMSEADGSPSKQYSLLGISLTIGCAVAAGALVQALLPKDPAVYPVVITAALGLVPVIETGLRNRRRDPAEDAARIRRGELRRRIPLVTALLAIAIGLSMSIWWGVSFVINLTHPLWSFTTAYEWSLLVLALFVNPVVVFLSGQYASHYLGKHPYRCTLVAFGCAFLYWCALVAVVKLFNSDLDWDAFLRASVGNAALSIIYLGVCLAGAWFGRRHQERFLAKKLKRVQARAARAAAAHRQSAAANEPHHVKRSGLALLKELKLAADLREAGVLTEQEFHEIRGEILLERLAHLRNATVVGDGERQVKTAKVLPGIDRVSEALDDRLKRPSDRRYEPPEVSSWDVQALPDPRSGSHTSRLSDKQPAD